MPCFSPVYGVEHYRNTELVNFVFGFESPAAAERAGRAHLQEPRRQLTAVRVMRCGPSPEVITTIYKEL